MRPNIHKYLFETCFSEFSEHLTFNFTKVFNKNASDPWPLQTGRSPQVIDPLCPQKHQVQVKNPDSWCHIEETLLINVSPYNPSFPFKKKQYDSNGWSLLEDQKQRKDLEHKLFTFHKLRFKTEKRDQYWIFMVEGQDVSAYLSVSVDCVTLIGNSFTNFQRFQLNRIFHDSTGLWWTTLALHIVRPQ